MEQIVMLHLIARRWRASRMRRRFSSLERGARVRHELERDDHFGENLADRAGERQVERAIATMMPPNGARLSVRNAFSQASRKSASLPTPQGLVCLRIATIGSLNSAISSAAA